MSVLLCLLQAVLVLSQTWCGQPECPARPKCSNAELDLIIAIDESCSMVESDFNKEKAFSTALTAAAEKRFNVTRFGGIIFGHSAPSLTAHAATIIHPMAPGAAAFNASLPSVFDCGGTPTDEALMYFYQELKRTQIPNRMQVAVLLTDGIPTRCYTKGGICNGQQTTANTQVAADAAITERFNSTKLPALGSIVITVGIGSSLDILTGATQKYGPISGKNLLRNFASAPQFAFLASDFNVLVNETLKQVLDLLCFYTIKVESPAPGTCSNSGQLYTIKGYNVFPMGTPKCRWQEVGSTTNYLYTNATITETNGTFDDEPGTIGSVSCAAPAVTKDPFNAYLEISRDGTYYTNNQISVIVRKNCSAPLLTPCPNSTIAAFFGNCTPNDFGGVCSATCKRASSELGAAFGAHDGFDAFDTQSIKDCLAAITGGVLTAANKDAIATKKGDPCTPVTASSAWAPVVSLLSLVCGISLFC